LPVARSEAAAELVRMRTRKPAVVLQFRPRSATPKMTNASPSENVDGVYIVATLSARTNFFLYQKQPLPFVARVMLHVLREAHWLNAG
jgi:hypothetical protein